MKKLQRMQIAEEANMESEIRQMKQFYLQNSQMGGSMSDQKFAQNILAALSSSWDPLVNSILMTSTLDEVTGRILSKEACRAEHTMSATTSTALITKGAAKPKFKLKFRKGVFCHNCNKEGHIKVDCRSAKAQTSGNDSRSSGSHAHVVELTDKADSYAFASHEGTFAFIAKAET